MGEQDSYEYDLAVAYRIYPKVSKPAKSLPLGNDKLQQGKANPCTALRAMRGIKEGRRSGRWQLAVRRWQY